MNKNNDVYIIEKIRCDYDETKILKYFAGLPYAAILDSSLKSDYLGHYTIIAYDPFLTFEAKGNNGRVTNKGVESRVNGSPLELLRTLLIKYKTSWSETELPFVGGCIGYFSYDLANFIEELPQKNSDDMAVNDIEMGFYNKVIVIDHIKAELFVVGTSSGMECEGDCSAAAEKNAGDIKKLLIDIMKNRASDGARKKNIPLSEPGTGIRSNFDRESYIKMVEKARHYIYDGDIFQVNLSQRFEADICIDPEDLYFMLRQRSPAPFSTYLNFSEIKVISSSPERFIKIKGNNIETRPIKGTRPRGRDINEDKAFKDELVNSKKDHAELTMIVDLERNDLGRVCKIGSVKVDKHADVEEYANVFHLVSTVSGELKEGIDIVDCIYATFPGGSITGAPKIRAMEIIEELEPVKRNLYTGAIGYIGFQGDVDLNIVIRTIIVKGNKAYYSVGGGIVFDSVPEMEYYETMHKGRKMMEVLREAGKAGEL